jgi:hypothetical protein
MPEKSNIDTTPFVLLPACRAGKACSAFHDETVRNVKAKRAQVDEIWSFTYAKAKNVRTAKAAPVLAPVAIRMTWTALPITSAGRFSPLGPRGIGFQSCFRLSIQQADNGSEVGVKAIKIQTEALPAHRLQSYTQTGPSRLDFDAWG